MIEICEKEICEREGEIVKKFLDDLLNNMVNLEVEIAQKINENFWDLLI